MIFHKEVDDEGENEHHDAEHSQHRKYFETFYLASKDEG